MEALYFSGERTTAPMEKRSITGRDILRMDGLLPPTRRLPVCDAVTSSSDKKKEKKWSIGGILRRISSIRDYDSSSNEEEVVYCKRGPRNHTAFNRKKGGVILRPVKKNSNQYLNKEVLNSTVQSVSQSPDTLNFQRDSIHSRSSDGSLDGLGRKTRKNKLKARAQAKRDRACGDSSSDEGSRKSCNSLTRFPIEDCPQNSKKNNSCHRRSRAARTERYIKRLSKDDVHGPTDSPSDLSSKRSSIDLVDENQRSFVEEKGPFRHPTHSRRFVTQSNNHTFLIQRSTENLREPTIGLPDVQRRSFVDLPKYYVDRSQSDWIENSAYAKPNIFKRDGNFINQHRDNYFLNPSMVNASYAEPCDYTRDYQVVNRSACPPEPPPRDPRCRLFTYGYHSFPLNGKSQRVRKLDDAAQIGTNDTNRASRNQSKNLQQSYESNNEVSWCESNQRYPRRPLSLNATRACNSDLCTNNKHNSTGRHMDENAFNETEAMKCQRRNNRNEQLNYNLSNYDASVSKQKFSPTLKSIPYENASLSILNDPLERLCIRSPSGHTSREYSHNISTSNESHNENDEQSEKLRKETARQKEEQESLERKRSSKNLEEALSELEAIYNSLRLGDEDLLDRAEQRTMEEFSLKHGKTDDPIPLASPDSDRTKDDMAYRRMHPKERPASLSDVVGQSALSNISYLMASPILSRKDATDNYLYAPNYPARRDEPDVTRDDVVYRSIHHANNTLKVLDPQPPFGIPLGPVTTATESDYLHTTPTKPDHPRSPYIPQCEPDIVTDDLAYRALRKDANCTKNASGSNSDLTRDPRTTFGMKKKRAVRSLSANLYGLINHDRIHLRREPSLEGFQDELKETPLNLKSSFPDRSDCLRRVVSDGELSDYDTRWQDSLKSNNTDINGNHSNLHRKKLRVYVSPSTRVQSTEKESSGETEEACSSTPSDAVVSSKGLFDEFWHDFLRSESNDTPSTNKETESDFTAYSRLCQDLVNLIKDDDEVEPCKEERADPDARQSVKIDNLEGDTKFDEPSVLHIQSLGSHYSRLDDTANDKEALDNEEIEDTRLTESTKNIEKADPEKPVADALDFYLRVADENVKLIAEAFSSVADHLCDSRLSHKNSLTPRRSEIENDSATHDTSTRSSVSYNSQDDGNDEQSSSPWITDKTDLVPKNEITTILEGDHGEINSEIELQNEEGIEAELDLSRAVHDLQVATASLRQREKEIDELEARLRNEVNNGLPCAPNIVITQDESVLTEVDSELKIGSRDQGETLVSADIVQARSDPDCEGESTECCEFICKSSGNAIAHSSTEMRVAYVTNLITVMITTYSMVLLACLLALLLP